MGNIELGERWLEEVLAIISIKDEADRINKRQQDIKNRLKRMAKTHIDGLIEDNEYSRQKKVLEMELESLVVPEVRAAEKAGKLLQDFARLWSLANLEEQRKLLVSVLDAVYIDTRCFWWRRGRIELPVQKRLPRIYYKLSRLFNLIQLTSAD